MKKSLAIMAAMAALFVATNSFISAQEPAPKDDKKAEAKADDGASDVEAIYKEIDSFLKSRPASAEDAAARPATMTAMIEKYKDVDFGDKGYVYVALLTMTGQTLDAAKAYETFLATHGEASDGKYRSVLGGIFPKALQESIKTEKWKEAEIYLDKGSVSSTIAAALSALEGMGSAESKEFHKTVMNKLLYTDKLKDADRLTLLKRLNAPSWPKKVGEVPEGSKLNITDATTLDGETVNLSDYKGKVVLVDFWATWCGPCIREMPHVVAAYEKYHDKGFEILAVSFDNEKKDDDGTDATVKKVKDFMAEHKMTWKSIYDGKGWSNEYGIRNGISSIPAAFLVDHTGKLRYMGLRGDALSEKVGELIADLEASKEDSDK